MDKQQAFKLLGLSGNESVTEIENAYKAKLSLVKAKCESAPTEALKEKFEQFKYELSQAQQILTAQHQQNDGQNETPNQSSSPLSQTKMADLPEAGSQATTDALEVGSVLAERYQIKAFIAQGGMGAVYRAFDKNRNQDIAIKVMLPQLMQNESARERFLDEARLSSQLSHPNIVNVFDVIQDNGLCFLTMELLEGQDLRQLMENRRLVKQPFDLDDVIEILEPICAGLNHAHELTVHRDIEPENIYLTEDGKYKLMDFGIARVMSTSQRTQTGAASGTAYYMAPEQLKGSKNIDGRADQYALAVLTYELLSGEVPAGAIEPLHELVKGLNKKLSDSVQKALSPKPDNRFENLAEFLSALQGKRKGSGAGLSMPSLPLKGIGIAAVAIIAILGIGSLASNGGLDSIWQAIKPVDKALIAEKKAEAQRILNDKKAEVAKLQGEIKNYQKRLSNGQRNLTSEIRDAERNNSSDIKNLKHWQRLTNDYIFDGNDIVELEGELSKGDNLLRQGTTVSIEQANTTLTQVRDGYKNLWAQFNAAEDILSVQEAAESAQTALLEGAKKHLAHIGIADVQKLHEQARQAKYNADFVSVHKYFEQASSQWQTIENDINDFVRIYAQYEINSITWEVKQEQYQLKTPPEAVQAQQSVDEANKDHKAGDYVAATVHFQDAVKGWKAALALSQKDIERIDKQRKEEKLAKMKEEKQRLVGQHIKAIEEMVRIPEGMYLMGCVSNVKCEKNMTPIHWVSLRAFDMNETEITFAQWNACVVDGGCEHNPYPVYTGEKSTPVELLNQPVFHVSYDDITEQFIPWLNRKTNKVYRLPSESEWEYAARGHTLTVFSWGNSVNCNQAIYGLYGKECGKPKSPVAVKSYQPNKFGLYDMHGNVSEWTEDCWNDNYNGAPTDGKPRYTGNCAERVQRGGSYQGKALWIRSASRLGVEKNSRLLNHYGFRLVRDL